MSDLNTETYREVLSALSAIDIPQEPGRVGSVFAAINRTLRASHVDAKADAKADELLDALKPLVMALVGYEPQNETEALAMINNPEGFIINKVNELNNSLLGNQMDTDAYLDLITLLNASDGQETVKSAIAEKMHEKNTALHEWADHLGHDAGTAKLAGREEGGRSNFVGGLVA